jgi:DnaA family protein
VTHPQLPLGVQLRDSARFENFLVDGNREIVSQLRAIAGGAEETQCYCWAPPGHGKTHLLQAACHLAQQLGRGAMYIPLRQTAHLSPDLLEGLAGLDLVCIDDVETIAGRHTWEEALFTCYNRLRDAGTGLLVSADRVPARLPLVLPDLRSRLEWGLVYRVKPLDDEQRLRALQLRARNRGFDMPEETGRYLLHRGPRALPALFDLLETLDTASLAAQKKLTVPFVKDVLGF